MKLGIDPEFVRRTVHNQTQPLQLCVIGTFAAVLIVCGIVFGAAYEADSLVIAEHELETANATAMHLEKSNAIIQRRLKASGDETKRKIAIADDSIAHLKQRYDQCSKLLFKCSTTEEEEEKELAVEKTIEQKLEKQAKDLSFMMNLQEHEMMVLQNQSKQANATMKHLLKLLKDERAIFEKRSELLVQANEELYARLTSQVEDLQSEVDAKQFGIYLLQVVLFICVISVLCLAVILYGKRINAPWLPPSVKRFIDSQG